MSERRKQALFLTSAILVICTATLYVSLYQIPMLPGLIEKVQWKETLSCVSFQKALSILASFAA